MHFKSTNTATCAPHIVINFCSLHFPGIPHTGLKKEALNILLTLSSRLIEKKAVNELTLLKKTFDEILITLQRDNAPEIKIRLKDIKDKLNAI